MRFLKYLLLILIVGCGTETTNLAPLPGNGLNFSPGGTAGLASGTLLDNQENPIWGATLWTIPGTPNAFLAAISVLAHTEFENCPEPAGEIAHGTCSNEDGEYEIDCSGFGPVAIQLLNAHGEPLPEVEGLCGGAPVVHGMEVGPQPTPCPHDSEDEECGHGHP